MGDTKFVALAMPYSYRKRIEKTIGFEQFTKNANQILGFERRMINSHVFTDFHFLKGLENPYFAWNDDVIDMYSQSDASFSMFCTLVKRVLEMDSLPLPASDIWMKTCFGDYYRALFDIIGFSPESIIELIYTTDSSGEFMRQIESKILDKNMMPRQEILEKVLPFTKRAQLEPTKENALIILENVVNTASALYFYEDAVRFVVDTDCAYTNDVLSWIPEKFTEQYPVQDLFQYAEDVMVDFRLNNGEYSSFTVRLENLADHIIIYNQTGKVIAETDNAKILSIYAVQDTNIFTNFTQIVLIKDCLDQGKERVFVMQHTTDFNCQFGCKPIHRCVMVRSDKRGSVPVEVCSLKRSKIEQDRCFCNLVEPFRVLSLCAYVLDCYSHRNSIGKQQGLRDSLYQDVPVSAHLKSYEKDEMENGCTMLPLHEYYELEKENLQSGKTYVAERTRKKVGEFKDITPLFSAMPTTTKTRKKFRS